VDIKMEQPMDQLMGKENHINFSGLVNVYSLRTGSHGPVEIVRGFPLKVGGFSIVFCNSLPEGNSRTWG